MSREEKLQQRRREVQFQELHEALAGLRVITDLLYQHAASEDLERIIGEQAVEGLALGAMALSRSATRLVNDIQGDAGPWQAEAEGGAP